MAQSSSKLFYSDKSEKCNSEITEIILLPEVVKEFNQVRICNLFSHNIFSGVLKDFLRELPEPLFTNSLYQMLLDALSVRMPGDPDGSAKLMLSILDCLPKANQVGIVENFK